MAVAATDGVRGDRGAQPRSENRRAERDEQAARDEQARSSREQSRGANPPPAGVDVAG